MCDLFLKRKNASLQRSAAQDFGGVSQIKLFFFWPNIRKQHYGLPQEILELHNFHSNDNMNF